MDDSPSITSLIDNRNLIPSDPSHDLISASPVVPETEHNINTNSPSSEDASQIKEHMTGTLLLAVFAAISGTSFHFGYASGVMNAPQDFIEEFINDTNHKRNPETEISASSVTLIFSLAVSIFALGGMVGGLFGGFITDRLGRKGGMYLNTIVSFIACILMFISKPISSYEVLIAGRFVLGLSCGYGSSVAPTYINEVSPSRLRGTLGASFQLGIVVILFVSQITSLESVLGSATTWHYALSLPIVFSILQVILLFLVPESPKYLLLKKNNPEDAEKGTFFSFYDRQRKNRNYIARIYTNFK